jgi:hypothetical protein
VTEGFVRGCEEGNFSTVKPAQAPPQEQRRDAN